MKIQTENAGHMYIKLKIYTVYHMFNVTSLGIKHNLDCSYFFLSNLRLYSIRLLCASQSSSLDLSRWPLLPVLDWHMNMRSQTNFLWTLILVDIQQLETHMKNKQQREQDTRDPLIGQLQQTIDNFQSSTDQMTSNITSNIRAEVQHQIQMMVGKWVSQCLFLINWAVNCLWLESCRCKLLPLSHSYIQLNSIDFFPPLSPYLSGSPHIVLLYFSASALICAICFWY